MNESDPTPTPVNPDYVVWADRQRRAAESRARRLAEKDTRSPSRKAEDARLQALGSALSDPTRWRILLELGKGHALPVAELARRTGRRADAISKHMALLRRAGLVQRVFSTCYTLPAAMRPEPGATVIDLGPCLLKTTLPPVPAAAASA